MSETEITNAQYIEQLQWAYDQGYVDVNNMVGFDTLDESDVELFDFSGNDSQIYVSEGGFATDYPDYPIGNVTWFGKAAYCDWLSLREGLPRAYFHASAWWDWTCNNGDPYGAIGYRMPTEAEWELACRAGTATHFNVGQCLDSESQANFDGSIPLPGCPVGPDLNAIVQVKTYPPNGWGLYEMHGNMLEQSTDRFVYEVSPQPVTDPVGEGATGNRVGRGGNYGTEGYKTRSAIRFPNNPNASGGSSGIRVVRTIN
jgi:formylglycine-generating enzyme required for sulfatase activity